MQTKVIFSLSSLSFRPSDTLFLASNFNPLFCKHFFNLIPRNKETVLGFEVTIFSNVDVTLAGGWDDTIFLELSSVTSDMSSGFVGSWILVNEGFKGIAKLDEEIDEVEKLVEDVPNDDGEFSADSWTIVLILEVSSLLTNSSTSLLIVCLRDWVCVLLVKDVFGVDMEGSFLLTGSADDDIKDGSDADGMKLAI